MDKKVVRIPIDNTKFNNKKIEQAQKFLNNFFYNTYKCSFVYDEDNVLCLEISKV